MDTVLSVLHAWPFVALALLLAGSVWQLWLGPSDDCRRKTTIALNVGALAVSLALLANALSVGASLREHEQNIAALQKRYDARAADVERARAELDRSAGQLKAAQDLLIRTRTEAGREFDRAAAAIRKEYAAISDAELSRRIDAILRRARSRFAHEEGPR